MKRSQKVFIWLVVLALGLASAGSAFAFSATNGQAASLVLGQPNFTSTTAHLTDKGFYGANGIAVDPISGKIFVSDGRYHRILRFASSAAYTTNASAEAVFGQINFTTATSGLSQSKMNGPYGITIDSAGRLWVADTLNSRVLRFDHASSIASGANADGVLGQPNFTTKTAHTTRNGMNFPEDVAVDSAGRLWVVDSSNNRILRFDNAATKANGANADGVLGQSSFTTSVSHTTQNGMNGVTGIEVDSAGRLWAGDWNNYRILRFDNAAAKANGANADGVLGEPDFTTAACNLTQNGVCGVGQMTMDSSGTLWATDSNSDRVLGYAHAATLANGANASVVLGQPSFTQNTYHAGATGMSSPAGIVYDAKRGLLWMADWNASRVVRYGQMTVSVNGGFNAYTGASKVPNIWTAANFTAADGKDATYKQDGTASVKITGTAGKTKTLTQTILMGGKSGDAFTFSFWERGVSIPLAGTCQAQLLFYNGATFVSSMTKTIPCAAGSHTTFQNNSLAFKATAVFTKAVIKFTYAKNNGTVWFDAVSLMR